MLVPLDAPASFFSVAAPGTSSQFPNSILKTLVVISSNPPLPSAKISKNLDFENFPIEYSFDHNLKE
jgi:hypothetical protein